MKAEGVPENDTDDGGWIIRVGYVLQKLLPLS